MVRNGFYNIAGSIVRTGLGIAAVPLLIRLLGVDQYGLWSLVWAAVGIVAVAEAGLSVSTTVFVSQDLARGDPVGLGQTLTAVMSAMIGLATFAAMGLWLGGNTIADFLNLSMVQQATAAQALQVGAVIIWTKLYQQIFLGVEQAYQRYDIMNILITGQAILSTVGLIGIAWIDGRIVTMMQWQAALSVAALVAHGIVVFTLLRPLKLRPRWNTDKSLAIGRYSLLTWLSSLGGAFFSQGDRLIVGRLLGTRDLGIYAAITSITTQINSLSSLPVQPLIPALSAFWAKRDLRNPALREHLQQALDINAFIALGLGGALFTVAPLAIQFIAPLGPNKEYTSAFQVAVLVYSLYSLNAVGFFILLGIEAVTVNTVIVLSSGTISLLLIAIGATHWGLAGAVLGNSGYLMTLLLPLIGTQKLAIQARPLCKSLGFPFAWFAVAVAVGAFIPNQFELRMSVIVIQSVILCAWFIRKQEVVLNKFTRRALQR